MTASKKLLPQNVYKGIVFGVLIAITISLLLSLIFTWLVLSEKISENSIKLCTMITICVASFSGAAISVKSKSKQRLLVGPAVSAVYLVVLLMSTALFFEGQYQNILINIVMALIGALLACVLPSGKKTQTGRTRKKRLYR